jgi:hypothetical protein
MSTPFIRAAYSSRAQMVDDIRDKYRAGMSAKKLAQLTGMSESFVYNAVVDITEEKRKAKIAAKQPQPVVPVVFTPEVRPVVPAAPSSMLPTITVQLRPDVDVSALGAIAAMLMNRPEVVAVAMPKDLRQRAEQSRQIRGNTQRWLAEQGLLAGV